ncbi:MAG: hypothetical protein DRP32_08480, partial [Thermotogae bacterium]
DQGAEPINLSLEETMSQMLSITLDTLTNTAIFGIGFGAAGGLTDASVYIGQRKIHNVESMTRVQRKLLSDLPTMKDVDLRQIPGETTIDFSHISDEELRIKGQQVYESAKADPMMPAFMSPAQRLVLQEYVKRESFNAKLSDAIEVITGFNLSTIEGLVDYQDDPPVTPLENAANFHQRITNSGENVLLDGTPITFEMEDGTMVEVRIITQDDNIAITVHKGDDTGPTGTIIGKAGTSGAMDIVSIKAKEFDNPLELESLLYTAIPKTYLFDDYNVLSPEDQTILKELKRIRQGGVSRMSKAALEAILELTKKLEEANAPLEAPPDGKVYRRKVPVVRNTTESYWEETAIEEDVPVDDFILDDEASEAAVTEEAAVEEAAQGATERPRSRTTTQIAIARMKQLLVKGEMIFSQMEDNNIAAFAIQEPPPHDLEANARELEAFRDSIAEMEAQEQLIQEEFDVLNAQDVPSVEEDVTFSDDISKQITTAQRIQARMLAKGVDPDMADAEYRKSLLSALSFVDERLNQRRVENQMAIQNGEMVPYNVSSLLNSRATLNESLGIELRETTTDNLRVMQSLQSSQMRRLDLIQESLNGVFAKYNQEMAFKDLKGFARKAAIIESHRAELNVEALRRFEGRKINPLGLVELGRDRLQFYHSIQEMNDTGVVRRARMLSVDQRVKGVMTPSDLFMAEQESTIETPRVETTRDTEQRTQRRSVRKTRRVKVLVEEDQVFSKSSNPEATTRRHILEQETTANRTFAEDALTHVDSQISVIQAIIKGVKTTKAKKMLDMVGVETLLNLRGRDESGVALEGSIEGATDLERQREAESLRKSIDKLPMKTLDSIYRQVVGIGQLDIRLGGYKIGDTSIAPSALANMIARETSTTPMYGNKGEKVRGDMNQVFFSMYDWLLSYSTVVEKVRGKGSLFYKVFFSDIQDKWLAKGKFDLRFMQEFGEQFNSLPGVESSKVYWQEEMAQFGDFTLTKDTLISLLQHQRNEYNWTAIRENGISVMGADRYVPLGMDRTTQIVEFVEEYARSDADQAAMDIYQSGMDRLYGLANTYNLQINGAPLQKDDFYMRLRPEFLELEGKQQFLTGDEQKVSLWSD